MACDSIFNFEKIVPHEFKLAKITRAHQFALEIPNLGSCLHSPKVGVCDGFL